MARYEILQGSFTCHTCKEVVATLRWHQTTKEMTWMCKDKHLSTVNLNTKKKKADYDREERE